MTKKVMDEYFKKNWEVRKYCYKLCKTDKLKIWKPDKFKIHKKSGGMPV
jgi:hypothetical protein